MDCLILLIGVLLGIVIAIVFCAILYQQRWAAFAHCPVETRICRSSDYYNDPADALAHGAVLSEILHREESGALLYRRYQRNAHCVPGPDAVVTIAHPQYCTFTKPAEEVTGVTGNEVTGRAQSRGIPLYRVPGQQALVRTGDHCVPLPGGTYTQGRPQIRWDKAATLLD